MRVDVFRAKEAAAKALEESGQKLSPEEARVLEKSLSEGKRNGLALPDEKREQLMKLKKDLAATSSEFSVGGVNISLMNIGFMILHCRKTSTRKAGMLPSLLRNLMVYLPTSSLAIRSTKTCTTFLSGRRTSSRL
jgi:Zn-dependent oligopeptidase